MKIRALLSLTVLTAGLMVPVRGEAVVITSNCASGTSCLMSELLSGGAIIIDDKLITNFTAFSSTAQNNSPVPLPNGTPVTADNIRVFSQDELGALGVPGEVGLAFNFGIGNPSQSIFLDGGQTMSIHWEYDVIVLDPSLAIVDNTLLFPGGIFNGASISSIVDLADGASLTVTEILTLGLAGQEIARKLIQADFAGSRIEDHRDFMPLSGVHVVTDIAGNGGLDLPGTNVQLEYLVQSFSQASAPEPATIALLAVGLAGLGFARRR